MYQTPRNAAPTIPGGDGQVQQLAFALRNRAGGEESGHAAIAFRDQEIVLQIVRDGPLRGLRTGPLDGRDFRQIPEPSSPENCHILVGIMRALVTLLFFLAEPFWETKPAEDWTMNEIATMRSHSPWAQVMGPAPTVLLYLATASPIEEAESELRVRSKGLMREVDPDFAAYITQHRNQNLVLAIPYGSLVKLG